MDEDMERRESKEVKKYERKEKIKELIKGDDMDFVPMN